MEAAVRAYYDAIDDDDYDRLASLLTPEFEHDRADRTLAGRETFVSFMRDDRPQKDTVHELGAVYRPADSVDCDGDGVRGERDDNGAGDADGGRETEEWAARGRLLGSDGDRLFEFVDAFSVDDDGRFVRLRTFTR